MMEHAADQCCGNPPEDSEEPAESATHPVRPKQLLLTARQSAELVGIGLRSWQRCVSSGKAPQPVRIGGAVRWRRAEIRQWIADGCPRVRTKDAR